jgi:exonuclease III
MLEQTEPDIIIASETWLHQGILEREVLPENYRFVARRDRSKSAHGGVAVITKSIDPSVSVVELVGVLNSTKSSKKLVLKFGKPQFQQYQLMSVFSSSS